MDNQMINGRVNILQPDMEKQFAMYDRIPAHQPSGYRDALQGKEIQASKGWHNVF